MNEDMVEEGSACQSKQQMMDATFYAQDFAENAFAAE